MNMVNILFGGLKQFSCYTEHTTASIHYVSDSCCS